MNKLTLLFTSFFINSIILAQNKQEVVHYEVNYGFIQVGEAQYGTIKTNFNGLPSRKVFVKGNTVGLWDWMYSIKYHFRSFTDPTSGVPFHFIRETQEGRYQLFRKIDFLDTIAKIEGKQYPIKPKTYDIVAAFYQLRQMDWTKIKKGDQIILPVFESKRNYPLILTKLGEETLDTDLGEIKAYKLKPRFKKGRVLQSENALVFWVSQKGAYPVKIEFDLPVGSLSLDIVSTENLEYDILN